MVHMCVVDRFKDFLEEVSTDTFVQWRRLAHKVNYMMHIAFLVKALGNIADLFLLGLLNCIWIPSDVLNNSVVVNS